ncbi:hypothetical protein CF336_g8091 [Tilletia laevis]|nr:hypothetical protein CF336_g8091 [Tilletia laevis]
MSVVPSTVARATSVRSASEPASGPPGQPTDVERLANLTKANPAAAAAARALITAGHSIGKAVEWMEKAIQPTPGSNTPPVHAGPTTATGVPATPTAGQRSGSAPPTSTPKQNGKRRAQEDGDTRKAKKTRPSAPHRALSPEYRTEDEDDGLDLDESRVNTTSYAEKWPADRIVKQVRALNYVPMWYFSDAGCALAAKERRDGTSQAIFMQLDGGLKPTGHPNSLIDDHRLSPEDFANAASLWVDVALRAGVSRRMVDSMILLNAKLIHTALWRQNAVIAMRWHDHQRSTWLEKRHEKGHFKLEALGSDALEDIRVATAAEDKAKAEARIAALEAIILQGRAGQGSQGPHKTSNFRSTGGAGPSNSTRGSGSFSACLRCGSSQQHKVNRCLPAKRIDGSAPTLVADPTWTNGVKFADNGDRICINYNTSSCSGCKNPHRCTWCGGQGHGHQQCPTAPHRA